MQEPIPEEVIEQLQKIQRRGERAEMEDTLNLLKTQLHQLRRVFICIDAVDELESKVRQQLLKVLQDLVMNDNVRLFLTGRDNIKSDVQNKFNVTQGYAVNISASQQDIREFVRQQITEDHEENPEAMDEGLEQEIIDTIAKKSQGM